MVGSDYVYRLVWEAKNGPLEPGHVLHHECETTWCINPDHVDDLDGPSAHAVIHKMGGDWGQSNKTHCPAGHPYSDENTYIFKRKNGKNERHCRACRLVIRRRYVQRLKEKKTR